MRALNAIDIAGMAVSSSNSTFLVLELDNGGSSSRYKAQFPSLGDTTLDMLTAPSMSGAPVFLEYAGWLEAADAFARLTADCAENDTGGLITGTITFVGTPFNEDDGIETVAWDLIEDSRPVFSRTGCTWTREAIAERI